MLLKTNGADINRASRSSTSKLNLFIWAHSEKNLADEMSETYEEVICETGKIETDATRHRAKDLRGRLQS